MKISSLVSRAAGLALAMISSALAGSIKYEFTGGSLAPTFIDAPAGVTASNFTIGSGYGSVFDNGGDPNLLRLSGNDNAKSTTADAFAGSCYFSFSITIPAGSTVALQSIGLDYKATGAVNKANARIYSTIRGKLNSFNAVNDTIGVLGRRTTGTDAAFVSDLISLATPHASNNYMAGSNVIDGDFSNLSGGTAGNTITFYLPIIADATGTGAFVDLDNLVLNFATPVTPVALSVTDFRVLADRSSQISFTGTSGQPYSLMASTDLTGPVYRKHWTQLLSGNFGAAPVVYPDTTAVNSPKKFYVVANSALPKVRIMPVGDSITEGATVADGTTSTFSVYRGPLYDRLLTAGYRFEFVGGRTTQLNYKSPLYGLVSLKHEGQGGANAVTVAQNVSNDFAANPADIVLIHSGHNYDLGSQSQTAIIAAIEGATRSMINTCRTVNPKVIVLLAQVITSPKMSDVVGSTAVKYGYIPALNVRLAQVAAELNTPAQPVIIVDQATGWNTATDAYTDFVHPSATGAAKMADKWFAALAPLLE